MNTSPTSSTAECVLEFESALVAARAASDALCASGAIASLTGEPRPILVGHLQWLSVHELLIFTAYGDAPSDAHLLQFDEAMVSEGGSITFLCRGHVAGAIHRIEEADVDDPDDYRIAWELWQEVAPLHRPLIERCFEAIQSKLRN